MGSVVDDSVLIGYTHKAIVGAMRPDLAHPGRKIRRGAAIVATITADPCDCAEEHVEVWVREYIPDADQPPG